VLNTLAGSFEGLRLPGGGVFALRMDTFAQYYAGFGGAWAVVPAVRRRYTSTV
jgi:hypothetical protein